MTRTTPLTSLALLLAAASASFAQADYEYDPADWTSHHVIRFQQDGDSTVEAHVDSGRIVASSASFHASVETTVVGERLRRLRMALVEADDAEQVSTPTTLEVVYEGEAPLHVAPDDPEVATLVKVLNELSEALQAPITSFPLVTLARAPASPTRGFASAGFDGERLEVAYTLGERRHPLASYELEFAARCVLRLDQRRLEQGWEPTEAEPGVTDGLADEGEAWVLRLFGPARTFAFSAQGLRNLTSGMQGPAVHLRRYLDAHPVRERTILGRVVAGRVVGNGLTLSAQAPLDALLAELEGERVLVQAAHEQDATAGVVLYLIASTDDGILPVEGPGLDADSVRAMPDGFLPPNLPNVPNAQDGDRDWPRRLLELTWSQAEADALLAPHETPLHGMVGALGAPH